jgi:hypothetical protein
VGLYGRRSKRRSPALFLPCSDRSPGGQRISKCIEWAGRCRFQVASQRCRQPDVPALCLLSPLETGFLIGRFPVPQEDQRDLQSFYEFRAKPGPPLPYSRVRNAIQRSPMLRENARYESPDRDANSALWNIVAAQAGYRDADFPIVVETFSSTGAAANRSLWRIGSYLKRLATRIHHWSGTKRKSP